MVAIKLKKQCKTGWILPKVFNEIKSVCKEMLQMHTYNENISDLRNNASLNEMLS